MSHPIRYLFMNLGHEEFAIPLSVVREVIGVPETTPIPQSPPFFVGIMNLRGQVVSIMDLRTKIGIKPHEYGESAVIILDLNGASLGIVVDRVNSVLALGQDQIQDRPTADGQKWANWITGVYRNDKKLTLLMDLTQILSPEDRKVMQHAKAA